MEIIKISNLTKTYKNFKLDNVSFSLKEGTICGFIGENGAGKSTTMKILAGITYFNEGEVKIFDKEIKDLTREERENISFILDELNFPETIKLFQLEKILKNIFKNWQRDTFYKYLTKFGLDKTKKCRELSKGMKVKLNLAIAFSHNAKLFILDEPTNGLDPIARDEILDNLKDITYNGGSVLISSHIVEDLERVCNSIVFIHEGRIILDSDKKELLNKYEIFNLNKEQWDSLNKEYVFKYKQIDEDNYEFIASSGKYDLKNKRNANLSEIMILIVRGKNVWKAYF